MVVPRSPAAPQPLHRPVSPFSLLKSPSLVCLLVFTRAAVDHVHPGGCCACVSVCVELRGTTEAYQDELRRLHEHVARLETQNMQLRLHLQATCSTMGGLGGGAAGGGGFVW